MTPRLQRRALILSAILGSLGVFSGYALFVLVREQLISGRGTSFVLAVLVAGIMSFAIEWVRDVIRHGHEEPLRFSRVVVTIFTLMMFEIFVIALHEIPSWHLAEVSALPHQLLGTAADGSGHPLTNLLLLTAIWFVAGAVLAATLSWSIFKSFDQGEHDVAMSLQIARSTQRGIIGGGISAPLAALAAVLILRIAIIARLYFLHHAEWRTSMRAIVSGGSWGSNPFTGGAQFALISFLWLDGLWGGWAIGPLLTVAVYVALVVAASYAKNGWPMAILIIAGIVVFFQPLAHDLKALFAIPLLAALVWAIPGLVLGALNPLLRRPSELPREWGILACVAAGVLLIATWSRFNGWWIFPVILIAVAIVYFRRGVSVEEYWPFVALSVAIIVAGATSLIQYISFAGVFRQLHEVNSLPAYVVETPALADTLGLKELVRKQLMDPKVLNEILSKPIHDDSQKWSRPLLRFSTTQPSLFRIEEPTTRHIDLSQFNSNVPMRPNSGLNALATRPAVSDWTELFNDGLIHVAPTTDVADSEITAEAEKTIEREVIRPAAPHAREASGEHATAAEHEAERAEIELNPAQTARLLEICLSAAFAFWCTVAMLATWAMLRAETRPAHTGNGES